MFYSAGSLEPGNEAKKGGLGGLWCQNRAQISASGIPMLGI